MSKRFEVIYWTFSGLFAESVPIELKIEGFDPQNPGFGPSAARLELPLLPPETAVRRSSEIFDAPKCGLWREVGPFGTFEDHKDV